MDTNPYIHYSNLVGLPTPILASYEFNFECRELHINSVKEFNKSFFAVLQKFGEEEQCPLFFEHLRVQFGLDLDQANEGKKKPYRADLIRILKGWFFDSNRPEGAVLKGWVESRFGLRALFHKEPLRGMTSPEYQVYVSEKMHPRFHHHCIYSQLDLLYEYSQQFLRRFYKGNEPVTLYRGFNSAEGESQVVEKKSKKKWIIRNNCLASYSQDIERASEFGDKLVSVQVPFSKILCLPQALKGYLPNMEEEVLILGGDYESDLISYF